MNVVRDLFAFLARLAIGVIFIAHGSQKFFVMGMDMVVQGFGQAGIPLAPVSAWFNALVELVGGILFILGLFLPVVGVLLALNMLGALVLVHLPYGLFLPEGFEYVLTLLVTVLALGFNGGRWTLDQLVFARRTRQPAPEPASPEV
ncbi:putative oxidoreductase [Saccharopolyspora erythraea NRRL 2338]|uniref:Integral membrane protein n=2 Tax=Saccharopolyspora erythraea TaxID=1836 RepID=A4FFM7_SACEN|nr:DoxX family protein [Saccharopolyspora erythraea]PFG96571.1 putative oxidoreductase [Saccharopolyspora erythraea NRRL 2338]QRK93053.1 DoxX family protein [Saccharopolyspora erythraea]CAM02852.1 putative integral membrane protein [Saccharopolyspora erythraea NRRL 2338]